MPVLSRGDITRNAPFHAASVNKISDYNMTYKVVRLFLSYADFDLRA